MSMIESTPARPLRVSEPRRWLLAGLGIAFVGIAAVGVVVPGLPTTIFLLFACWCFARSCPWLEQRLIRNRFFRPFLVYLEPGARMPRRAKIMAITFMWLAIAISSALLLNQPGGVWISSSVVLAGFIGTAVIARR